MYVSARAWIRGGWRDPGHLRGCRNGDAPAVRYGARDGRTIGRIGGDPAEMMVAKGNPKAVATIDGLVRSNVRTSMPKPVNEGIMQF
jgi:hypothetical protein